jgi:SAM-dependent methyltransferase
MASVEEHYARHLAPIYLWMVGGAEAAFAAADEELSALGLPAAPGDLIVDLGAGFGMHAVPLARHGASVLAIDSSGELLARLSELSAGLSVRAVEDDLMSFRAHLTAAPAAIVCLGDTLTHLPDRASVELLVAEAAAALAPGGLLVLSFRDYSLPLEGDRRFLAVRSDETRILTCFLEHEATRLRVHDVLYERGADGWSLRVSSYPKLRLDPDELLRSLQDRGLETRREAGLRGMLRLVARKP